MTCASSWKGVLFLLLLTGTASIAEAQSGSRRGSFARRRPASTTSATNAVTTAELARPEAARALAHALPALPLAGYDVVALVENGQLHAGTADLTSGFDCRLYRFATSEAKSRFDADPAKFAPVLAGASVVALRDRQRLEPGLAAHRSVFEGRLFLFADAVEKETFDAAPSAYAAVDLAIGGISPVALVDENVIRPGDSKTAVVFEGRRIFFAGADERAAFLADPGKYYPTLGGYDPVSVLDGSPALGTAEGAMVYKNRLYLLANAANRDRFIQAPERYSDLDVATGGVCPVTLVEEGRREVGRYDLSVVYRGERFLFASEDAKARFLQEPLRFYPQTSAFGQASR